MKDKILNKKRKCDLAKNKTVLVDAVWTKRKYFQETSSFTSTVRAAVIGLISYTRPVQPEEIKIEKKTVTSLIAKARKQLKNRFRR